VETVVVVFALTLVTIGVTEGLLGDFTTAGVTVGFTGGLTLAMIGVAPGAPHFANLPDASLQRVGAVVAGQAMNLPAALRHCSATATPESEASAKASEAPREIARDIGSPPRLRPPRRMARTSCPASRLGPYMSERLISDRSIIQPEGAAHVLQITARSHDHEVEPNRRGAHAIVFAEMLGRTQKAAALVRAHRSERFILRDPAFHFNHDEHAALGGSDIDFAIGRSSAAGEDAVALAGQPERGERFGHAADTLSAPTLVHA
jgi:hypothetical protein